MKGALLSLLLALSFVALAASPAVQPAEAATSAEVVGGLTLYSIPPFKLLFYLNALFGGGNSDPGQAYDPTASKNVYASSLNNVTASYLANQHTNAANSYELLGAANYFFDRKAEWAAKSLYDNQTANNQTHTYDRDYVLSVGQLDRNATAYIYQVIANYNSIFNGYATLSDQFTGTYAGMYWGVFSGETRVSSSSTENPELRVIAGMKIDCTAGQYVYLPTDAYLTFIPQYGASSWSINITDAEGNNVYNATPSNPGSMITGVQLDNEVGRFNIAATGFYTFATIAAKATTSSGVLSPAVLMATPSGEGVEAKALYYKTGETATWASPSSTSISSTSLLIGFMGTSPLASTSLSQMISDIGDAIGRASAMLTEATNYGQAYFNAIVSSGGGTILPAPDVAFPDPSQMTNLTQEQISAIYFAYLNQLKDYFYNHTGTFDLSDVNISSVSLDLMCRGSITDASGTVLYDNLTVFTPFNSLKAITLKVGENTMDQPGFAILWGRTSTLSGTFTANGGQYVELKEGYKLNIEQMFYQGQPVTEKTLDITTIDYVVSPDANTPNSPQGINDAQWLINHWYWFAILVGAILCLAWIPTRNTAIGVIGLILVAVGAIGWILADSSTTTGLLSGLFNIRGRP